MLHELIFFATTVATKRSATHRFISVSNGKATMRALKILHQSKYHNFPERLAVQDKMTHAYDWQMK